MQPALGGGTLGGIRRCTTRRFLWVSLGVLLLATGAATSGGLTGSQAATADVVATGPSVSELALDPRSPDIVYAGVEDGVYRSADGGTSWRRSASDGPVGSVISVLVVPTRPYTIYAVSTENQRPNRSRLAGIWRSRDGGRHFAHIRGVGARWFARTVVASRESPNALYASTESFVSDGKYVSLYRSLDGGSHWTAAADGLEEGVIWSLAVHPSAPRTLYAANGSGLFRSTDRGDSWTLRWPKKHDWVAEVAIDPVTPETLYAAAGNVVFKSTNSGVSWQRLGLKLKSYEVATEIVVDPKDYRVVYAATTRPSWGQVTVGQHGVYRSTNGGRTWTQILRGSALGKTAADEENEITALVVDPKRPRLLVSTYAGVWRSLDAGRTWHRADTGLGEQTTD